MRYFTIDEFNCSETGENEMNPDFLELLDRLRHRCGFPFVITSGYRSKNHSIERKKHKPGVHSEGIAADIYVDSSFNRYTLIKEALELGFNGIGVAKTFIHVDCRSDKPAIWTY